MTVNELTEEIINMIRDFVQSDCEITLDTHLIKELGLTSVETMMLISDLEDRFGVTIPGKKLRDVWTVRDLRNVVVSALV